MIPVNVITRGSRLQSKLSKQLNLILQNYLFQSCYCIAFDALKICQLKDTHTVSYTHLDVYKRQVLCFIIGIGPPAHLETRQYPLDPVKKGA